MTLIDNWRKAWRMLTVVLAAALAALSGALEYWPQLQAYLPEGWQKWAFLAIIFARVVKQPSLQNDVA